MPIVKVTDLSHSQIRLLKLADNKVAEFSGWDFSELNKELEELKIELPELDFGELGFVDSAEIQGEDEDGETGEISDENYEPPENDVKCPKCGFIGHKSFFNKPTKAEKEAE